MKIQRIRPLSTNFMFSVNRNTPKNIHLLNKISYCVYHSLNLLCRRSVRLAQTCRPFKGGGGIPVAIDDHEQDWQPYTIEAQSAHANITHVRLDEQNYCLLWGLEIELRHRNAFVPAILLGANEHHINHNSYTVLLYLLSIWCSDQQHDKHLEKGGNYWVSSPHLRQMGLNVLL